MSLEKQEEVLSLDEEGGDYKLYLIPRENNSFPVDRKVATMSELVKTMADGDSDTDIPLPNVKGQILKKVIDYMQYHHENPPKDIAVKQTCLIVAGSVPTGIPIASNS